MTSEPSSHASSSSIDQVLYISNVNEIHKWLDREPSLLYATKDEFLQTLLHLACDMQTRNAQLARCLLERGAKIDVVDSAGNTPLHYACRSPSQNEADDVVTVELLLDHAKKQGVKDLGLNHKNKRKQLPLHIASNCPASTANDNILRRILAHKDKFDINAQDAKSKKKDMESLQLNSLLPVELENEERERKKQEKLKKGHTHKTQETASSQLANRMKQQYEDILSVKAEDIEKGYTALHYCVLQDNPNGVKLLLETGANVNITDDGMGYNPLRLGVSRELEKGSTEARRQIISLLLPLSNLTLVDKEGESLLHALANITYTSDQGVRSQDKDMDLASLILQQVTNKESQFINIRNAKGRTALIIASSNGNEKLVSFLLQHGANVQLEDDFGFKAIHEAASFGHLEVVKELVHVGADVNGKTNCFPESTPLHIAVSNQHFPVVQFLVDVAGAHILIEDAEGNVPANLPSSPEITAFLEDYVQLKIVHERTLVLKKDTSQEVLVKNFGHLRSLYGNALEFTFQTKHGLLVQAGYDSNESFIGSLALQISKELAKHHNEEAFILVSNSSKFLGRRVKVRQQGEQLFKHIRIANIATLAEFKSQILTKFSGHKQVKQIVILPDVLLEDEDDLNHLIEDGTQLEVMLE